jgi:hypothetical protein
LGIHAAERLWYDAAMSMSAGNTLKLRVVPHPEPPAKPPVTPRGAAILAPTGVKRICGNCGTLLLTSEQGQLHGFVVQCWECGVCNAVE